MDDSDSSGLSSAPASDDERLKLAPIFLKAKGKTGKKKASKQAPPETPASPPRPPRSPSPPHLDSLADNPDIAFLVMFRSRFSAAFPPKLPHLGPQDIERGVEGQFASPAIEDLLCALLGITLNRKKHVERGHHGRALEEALASQRSQWPRSWAGRNPTAGGKTFNSMIAEERLDLLRTLVIWSLSSSEVISQIIKDSYKQSRHDDDRNQPLSVQPWGVDGDKRRYWLAEGQDDTNFRLYRENAKASSEPQWYSMAGSIDEIKVIADQLVKKDTTQAGRRLASSIMAAIPRFEATEEKRKRREYRQMRRAQFARPEPGFSLYEGRTRGKRMRYTFDDDEDDSDDQSVRRSGRHSDRSTPAETGPVVTASGRQVRARGGGIYGESLLSGQGQNPDSGTNDYDSELSELPGRRASRNAASGYNKRTHIDTYNEVDQMSDEEDAASSAGWNSADNEDEADGKDNSDDDLNEIDDDLREANTPASLVVKLKVSGLEHKAPRISDRGVQEPTQGVQAGDIDRLPVVQNGHAATPRTGRKEDQMDWSPIPGQSSDAQGWSSSKDTVMSNGHTQSNDTNSASAYQTPSSLAPSETKHALIAHDDTVLGQAQPHHPLLQSIPTVDRLS